VADVGTRTVDDAASNSRVAFRLAGGFSVAVNGRQIEDRQVGSAKARRLLALLVVHRGQTVPTDRIVAALWGAEPPERAAENVATLVSRLRRVLGAAVIRRQLRAGRRR
jgi:DNA-binding SARP family transcriptional activator